MVGNISAAQSATATSSTSPSSKQEVNNDFLSMLTERFSNDDIPDANDDYRAAREEISKSGVLGSLTDIMPVDENGNHVLASREQVAKDFSSFQQMLNDALDEAGISKDPSFEINSSSSGKLYISGDHPDKEAIEQIINEVPNIRDTYQRMSAQSSILAAGERHEKFSRAYEIDPESAVNQYNYLFNSKPCDAFSIFVSEDDYSAGLISYDMEQDMSWLSE